MKTLGDILGGTLFDKARELITVFKLPADQAAQLQVTCEKIEADINAKLLDHDMQIIQAVNQTMQAEAKSEHWLQWSWRPCVGFTYCGVIINNYILLPYCSRWGLQPIVIPSDVWQAMLIILGVAAGTRGWQKIKEVEKENKSK